VITNNLWNVDGVRQYQFIQDGIREYTLKLNGDKDQMDLPDILGRIRPYLGEDAEIQVEFVQEIPVLASGKRKYIENHCPEYVPEIRRQHAGREDL
jgi:phenylacetate-CoA ligase